MSLFSLLSYNFYFYDEKILQWIWRKMVYCSNLYDVIRQDWNTCLLNKQGLFIQSRGSITELPTQIVLRDFKTS